MKETCQIPSCAGKAQASGPPAFCKESPGSFFPAALLLGPEEKGTDKPDRVQPSGVLSSDEGERDSKEKYVEMRDFSFYM